MLLKPDMCVCVSCVVCWNNQEHHTRWRRQWSALHSLESLHRPASAWATMSWGWEHKKWPLSSVNRAIVAHVTKVKDGGFRSYLLLKTFQLCHMVCGTPCLQPRNEAAADLMSSCQSTGEINAKQLFKQPDFLFYSFFCLRVVSKSTVCDAARQACALTVPESTRPKK